jgi:hypothetical protein
MKTLEDGRAGTVHGAQDKVPATARFRLRYAAVIAATALLLASATPQRHEWSPVSMILVDNGAGDVPTGQRSRVLASGPVESKHERPNGSVPVAKPTESLAAAFDRLAADADAGDTVSACLLSRGLARCAQIETMKIDATDWLDQAAQREAGSDDESRLLTMIAEMDSETEKHSAFCDGLSASQLGEAGVRMYQAGRLGDPKAMAHFALSSGSPRRRKKPNAPFDDLYRAHAVEMLERSASMGNVSALRALYKVYLLGMLPNGNKFNNGQADTVAAVAIGNALRDSLGKDEDEDFLISISLDGATEPDAINSSRYHSLKRKYSGYVHQFMLRKVDTGKSNDIAGCDAQRFATGT